MLKKVLVGAVAMTAATMFAAPQAQAFGWGSWGSHGSSGGSWGSHGSSGGSWGSHGSHGGLLHGLLGHIFHHSHGSSGGSWGSHGSSGGSWGSHGSSGGSWGSHGSSGGSWGSHGSSGGSWGSYGGYGGGMVSGGTYMEGEAVAPADNAESVAPPKADEGAINLHVPGDAKVFINGTATASTGSLRNYISRGLTAGKQYTFEVRAEVIRDGETISETKNVTIGAGKSASLDMQLEGGEQVAGKGVKTALIIRVPADAKITLAGQPTTSTGELREFATNRLANGAWANYPIRAEITKDGRTLVQERLITLKPGETKEISIDFAEAELASR